MLQILQKELPELGKKYGFSTEVTVVENTFRDTGLLEETHELLQDLNKVMTGAQQVLYDRMLRRNVKLKLKTKRIRFQTDWYTLPGKRNLGGRALTCQIHRANDRRVVL